MKKFGYTLLLFMGIPLMVFCILEIFIFKFKQKLMSEENLEIIYNNNTENFSWIKNINSDSIIILSGSSTVRYGLSCSILNDLCSNKYNYINIAMDARDPIQTYFILKNLDLKNISTIYFGIDPWVYSKRYYMHRNKYMYLDFNLKQILLFSNEHDKSALLKRYKSLLTLFVTKDFSYSSNHKNEIPEDYGSVALEKKSANFNESPKNWFQVDKYGWSELQFIYLKKIADLCKNKKIKFSVFIPPKRSDFSKDYKENCGLIHAEFLNKLSNNNFNSPIFGKFDQLDSLGDFENFTEAYHLNKKGQIKYSKIFIETEKKQKSVFSKEYKWFNF